MKWLCIGVVFVVITGGVFLLFYWPRRGKKYYMDPLNEKGAFEPHAKRYQDLAKLMVTLSAATVAFLLNFLTRVEPNGQHLNEYSIRLEAAAPASIILLAVSVGCALLFLLLQNLAYEDYCHSEKKDTYSADKYAGQLTLAALGFMAFFLAFALVAYHLMR